MSSCFLMRNTLDFVSIVFAGALRQSGLMRVTSDWRYSA